MPDMILPPDDDATSHMPELAAALAPMSAKTKLGKLRARRPYKGEGRPSFVPTPQQRQFVMVWRGTGIAPSDIARQIGISITTLNKHFADEMRYGMGTLVSKMSAKVVSKALSGHGDGNMLKFYLQNFGNGLWNDKSKIELTGKDGMALSPPNLVVSFLPMALKNDAGT